MKEKFNLQSGTLLQHGKYRIDGTLGQGGFGITYLATQVMLGRQVTIKEFFFRDYCERNSDTSRVTLGTQSNRELVERFRAKFVKEAQTVSKLEHPNLVHIYDVFDENGTSYFVMDYIDGESLSQLIERRGALSQDEAIGYVARVADALNYIHNKKINHLDIKPSNILRRKDGHIFLIDFGVAKQYDTATGQGTTTTPVGISHGYSPAEQYLQGGVQQFSPQSDVYALAATLFKLLTGKTPPESIVLPEEGLPVAMLANRGVSQQVIDAIVEAMKPRSLRTQSVAEFMTALRSDATEPAPDVTIVASPIVGKPKITSNVNPVAGLDQGRQSNQQHPSGQQKPTGMNKGCLWAVIVAVVTFIITVAILASSSSDYSSYNDYDPYYSDTTALEFADSTVWDSVAEAAEAVAVDSAAAY